MDSNNYFQLGLYLAVLLVLSLPLGWYMARVMEGKSRVNRLFGGLERVFYRLCGISREHEMDWKQYAKVVTKERDEAKGQINKLVIDGGIDAALDAAGMAPAFKRMLRRDFAAEHQIEIKDGQAFVGGEALSEAVKKWTETDEISGLKAAGQANGSRAPGGGKAGGKSLSDMSEADRLELARKNPERLRQMRSAG